MTTEKRTTMSKADSEQDLLAQLDHTAGWTSGDAAAKKMNLCDYMTPHDFTAAANRKINELTLRAEAAEAERDEAVKALEALRSFAASVWFDEATATDEEREAMEAAASIRSRSEPSHG